MDDEIKDNENRPETSLRKSNPELSLEEYRLVPVEKFKEKQDKVNEIGLLELAKHIWESRRLIAKIIGGFIFIGLLVAFLSPVEYQTEATLMPEMPNQQGQVGSMLQKYGGLLGLSGSSFDFSQKSTIPPQLYPRIVKSLPFQLQLLEQEVYFVSYDTTTTVFVFFNDIYTPSIFSFIKKYTIGMSGKVKEWILDGNKPPEFPSEFETNDILHLTKEQMEVIENMWERIKVSLDEESGVITVSSEMPDPVAAAIVGNTAIKLLTEYLKEYHTQKAMVDLRFVQEQYDKARQRFQKTQLALAEFRDKNRNVATSKAQTELEQLQNERDLAFNVYNSLAQQLEQARITVQEQTPVFKTLQPVQVPIEKSWPLRKFILLISILLGLIVGIMYALAKVFYTEVLLK